MWLMMLRLKRLRLNFQLNGGRLAATKYKYNKIDEQLNNSNKSSI